MKKIFGVGINDAGYPVRPRNEEPCPFYSTWKAMLNRCYSHSKSGVYLGVTTVCSEWLTFSKFRKWMESQEWEGLELDKDILGKGKLYSPKHCCFVPHSLNKIIAIQERRDGLPYGVYKVKRAHGYFYEAKLKVKNKSIFLGIHSTISSAQNAWCMGKSRAIYSELDSYKRLTCYREDVYWGVISKIPKILRG